MRILTVFLLHTIVCFTHTAYAEPLDMREQDKQLHFAISYGITSSAEQVLAARSARYPRLGAALLGIGIGLAKEISDPKFSEADLKADGLGVLTSTLFSYSISW